MDGNFAEQRFNNIIDEMAENFEFELIPNTAKLMNRLQEYGGNMSDVRR